MAVQSQALVSDASRLSLLLTNRVNQQQTVNTIVVIALIGIFIAYFLVNYLTTQRRALKGLATLQAGTAVIGSGNFDYRIEEKGSDEIGDLSRAVNRMTSDLKTVIASKTELEQEIEQRKKAEAEIAHLASFPELNPNPIIEIDTWGNVTYVNPAARKHFNDLIALGSKHPFLAGVSVIIEKGQRDTTTSDVEIGGQWYERTLAYAPTSQSYRVYSRDVTGRKKAEVELRRSNAELEASNKELEAFSYSVSHDLRAPLRSMEGFSNALLEDYGEKLDEQGKQYLRYVQESSDLMGQLINDLLKLSRVTRSEISYDIVDLAQFASSIMAERIKCEPLRKVELIIAPHITAYGDRNLLRLVLENLLDNAWKFSGKTTSPRIEMGVTEHNGKRTCFIRDNGAGFDMTYADKLFKPFQRLHRATEFTGTGVGLATVQRIIRRHGGEVWAESKVGEGATFYFTLD